MHRPLVSIQALSSVNDQVYSRIPYVTCFILDLKQFTTFSMIHTHCIKVTDVGIPVPVEFYSLHVMVENIHHVKWVM